MAEATRFSRCLSEFTGTFLLVFTIGCNVLTGQLVWGGVSIASTLTVLIYAFANVSGAHFNPAVSLALALAKKEKWVEALRYIAMQFAGGGLGGVAYSCFLWKTTELAPKPGYIELQACFAELLYTFMLVFVVLNVAYSKMHQQKNEFYGLAIGFVVLAGAYGAGSISGCFFNPAVAFGIDVSDLSSIIYFFSYAAFEVFGAIAAAFLFRFCRPEEKSETAFPPLAGAYGIWQRLVSEFLGTYMFVITVGLNLIAKSEAAAFSIAASLMCMVFALASVSGAHFNPAVTLAMAARGGCTKDDGLRYVVVQLLAGVAGALTYSAVAANWTIQLAPVPPYNVVHAFAGEIMFTFVLAFVVLSVATVKDPLSEYFAFAVGSCITVGGIAMGQVSGIALNPAVSIGMSAAHLAGGGGIINCAVYVIAEFLGGLLAAGAFRVTRPSEPFGFRQGSRFTEKGDLFVGERK